MIYFMLDNLCWQTSKFPVVPFALLIKITKSDSFVSWDFGKQSAGASADATFPHLRAAANKLCYSRIYYCQIKRINFAAMGRWMYCNYRQCNSLPNLRRGQPHAHFFAS